MGMGGNGNVESHSLALTTRQTRCVATRIFNRRCLFSNHVFRVLISSDLFRTDGGAVWRSLCHDMCLCACVWVCALC